MQYALVLISLLDHLVEGGEVSLASSSRVSVGLETLILMASATCAITSLVFIMSIAFSGSFGFRAFFGIRCSFGPGKSIDLGPHRPVHLSATVIFPNHSTTS